jgi:malate synthase
VTAPLTGVAPAAAPAVLAPGVPAHPRQAEVLTPATLTLVADLQRAFAPDRAALLAGRRARRERIAATGRLDFLAASRGVRDDPTWRVRPAPPDLQDRRVEITGPTDPRMVVNALNSGARVFMADLEDSNTPTWDNMLGGQVTLADAVRRRIDHTLPDGRRYRIGEEPATLVVRPRGWHLVERHVLVDGAPVVAALFDAGVYLATNAAELLARGSGPYLYLPKLESAGEAELWARVLTHTETALGLPTGSVRVTVLIETITAAFEMEEILFALRDHVCGLNAGRWDYVFSVIKNFRDSGPAFVLPDRSAVTMTVPFLRAYTELLVASCHRRGAHAIGGMAAAIPDRRDPERNARALAQVRTDKEREAGDGFDGSWVAHPDLVPTAAGAFDAVLGERPHQLDRLREDVAVTADELLAVAATPGTATRAGLIADIDVGLRYVHAWLGGSGAVAIHGLMEDVATAEISRSQVWQWLRAGTTLDDGTAVTAELVRSLLGGQVAALVAADPAGAAAAPRWEQACGLFEAVATSADFVDFLTLPGYGLLP